MGIFDFLKKNRNTKASASTASVDVVRIPPGTFILQGSPYFQSQIKRLPQTLSIRFRKATASKSYGIEAVCADTGTVVGYMSSTSSLSKHGYKAGDTADAFVSVQGSSSCPYRIAVKESSTVVDEIVFGYHSEPGVSFKKSITFKPKFEMGAVKRGSKAKPHILVKKSEAVVLDISAKNTSYSRILKAVKSGASKCRIERREGYFRVTIS